LQRSGLDVHIAGYMRLLLDTNVVVAGLRSPSGASAKLLRLVREERLTLIATVALFLEYEAVLTRDEHLAAAGITRSDAENALDVLARFAEPVETFFLWRPRLKDPNDDMVLEAAINGRAEAIVTFNARHFLEVVKEFGIAVISPAEALRRIRHGDHE
jgi:putative PIN family toxin of toxin-antitoxin system